jgi:hypothetical protein
VQVMMVSIIFATNARQTKSPDIISTIKVNGK